MDKLFYSYNSTWNSTSLDYTKNFPDSIVFHPQTHRIIQNGIIYGNGEGGPIFIKGSTTDNTDGIWTGNNDSIIEYYDGLSIIYIPNVNGGVSSTTLNINGLGAKNIYYNGTNRLTNIYEPGTPILLTYYSNSWRTAEYDTDTNTFETKTADASGDLSYYVGFYMESVSNKQLTYTNSNLRYNPNKSTLLTEKVQATEFIGNLTGNADTSTTSDYSTTSSLSNRSELTLIKNSNSSSNTYYITFGGTSTNNSYSYIFTDSGLNYIPNTNTLTASTFVGNLNGNASSANNAINANNASYFNVSDRQGTYTLIFSSGTSGNVSAYISTNLKYDSKNNVTYSPIFEASTYFFGDLKGNSYTATNADKLDGFHASSLLQTFTGGEISSSDNILTQDNHTLKIGDTEKFAGSSTAYIINSHTVNGGQLTSSSNKMSLSAHGASINGVYAYTIASEVNIINSHTADGGALSSYNNTMSLSAHTDYVNGISASTNETSAYIINSLSINKLISDNITNLTASININGKVSEDKTITDLISRQIAQTSISNLSEFTNYSNLIYAAAGVNNNVIDKPTSVDGFGVLSFKTNENWYGQLLVSSNIGTGIYWRTSTSLSGGWNKLLDSNNYIDYIYSKSQSDNRFVLKSGDTMTGHLTIAGQALYFGKTGSNAIISYDNNYPNYGIWYHDETVDKMTFSASNNANNVANADFAINGAGDGTLTARGNLIAHAGNITSNDATINTTLTEIATIAGVLIKAKVDHIANTVTANNTTSSGLTITIPNISVNTAGHITNNGIKTHTISFMDFPNMYWANIRVGDLPSSDTEPTFAKTRIKEDEYIGTGTGSQCHIKYNTTNNCLDFIFD